MKSYKYKEECLQGSKTPEELVGKYVIVLVNLKPAKLCGVKSNGMMLAADDGIEIVTALTTDKEIKPGSRIR